MLPQRCGNIDKGLLMRLERLPSTKFSIGLQDCSWLQILSEHSLQLPSAMNILPNLNGWLTGMSPCLLSLCKMSWDEVLKHDVLIVKFDMIEIQPHSQPYTDQMFEFHLSKIYLQGIIPFCRSISEASILCKIKITVMFFLYWFNEYKKRWSEMS